MIPILIILNLSYIYIYSVVISKGYSNLLKIITYSTPIPIPINISTSFYKAPIRIKTSYKVKANTNLTPT